MPASYLNRDMSPEERIFIVTYIRALRRDFWRLQSVMSLMDPELGLAVSDVTQAIELAKQVEDLHGEFEYDLKQFAAKSSAAASKIKLIEMPTVDQLASLFTLSFFKLVSIAAHDPPGPPVKIDNGWSSGQPGTLQTALNLLEAGYLAKIAEPSPPSGTGVGAAVFDLLSKLFNWPPPPAEDAGSFFDWLPLFKAPTGSAYADAYEDDDADYADDDEDEDWYEDYDSDSD